MTRTTEELRAELAMSELEDKFLEAKAAHRAAVETYRASEYSETDVATFREAEAAYNTIKGEYHEARKAYREQREANAAAQLAAQNGEAPASGDATVTPEPVHVSARATDLGGAQ